jgi:hypothetical protein
MSSISFLISWLPVGFCAIDNPVFLSLQITKDKIYFVGGPGLSISGVWNVTNVGLELGHVADSLLAWHVITGIF